MEELSQKQVKRMAYIVGNWDYNSKNNYPVYQNKNIEMCDLPGVEDEIENEIGFKNRKNLKLVLQKYQFQVQEFKNVVSDCESQDLKKIGFKQIVELIKSQILEAKSKKQEIIVFFAYLGHGVSKISSPNVQFAVCTDYKAINLDQIGLLSKMTKKCTIIGLMDCCRDQMDDQKFEKLYFDYTVDVKKENQEEKKITQVKSYDQKYFILKTKLSQKTPDRDTITMAFRQILEPQPHEALNKIASKIQQLNPTIETQITNIDFTFATLDMQEKEILRLENIIKEKKIQYGSHDIKLIDEMILLCDLYKNVGKFSSQLEKREQITQIFLNHIKQKYGDQYTIDKANEITSLLPQFLHLYDRVHYEINNCEKPKDPIFLLIQENIKFKENHFRSLYDEQLMNDYDLYDRITWENFPGDKKGTYRMRKFVFKLVQKYGKEEAIKKKYIESTNYFIEEEILWDRCRYRDNKFEMYEILPENIEELEFVEDLLACGQKSFISTRYFNQVIKILKKNNKEESMQMENVLYYIANIKKVHGGYTTMNLYLDEEGKEEFDRQQNLKDILRKEKKEWYIIDSWKKRDYFIKQQDKFVKTKYMDIQLKEQQIQKEFLEKGQQLAEKIFGKNHIELIKYLKKQYEYESQLNKYYLNDYQVELLQRQYQISKEYFGEDSRELMESLDMIINEFYYSNTIVYPNVYYAKYGNYTQIDKYWDYCEKKMQIIEKYEIEGLKKFLYDQIEHLKHYYQEPQQYSRMFSGFSQENKNLFFEKIDQTVKKFEQILKSTQILTKEELKFELAGLDKNKQLKDRQDKKIQLCQNFLKNTQFLSETDKQEITVLLGELYTGIEDYKKAKSLYNSAKNMVSKMDLDDLLIKKKYTTIIIRLCAIHEISFNFKQAIDLMQFLIEKELVEITENINYKKSQVNYKVDPFTNYYVKLYNKDLKKLEKKLIDTKQKFPDDEKKINDIQNEVYEWRNGLMEEITNYFNTSGKLYEKWTSKDFQNRISYLEQSDKFWQENCEKQIKVLSKTEDYEEPIKILLEKYKNAKKEDLGLVVEKIEFSIKEALKIPITVMELQRAQNIDELIKGRKQ